MGTSSNEHDQNESIDHKIRVRHRVVICIHTIGLISVFLIALKIGSLEFNPYAFTYLAIGAYLVSLRTFTVSARSWASKHYDLTDAVYISFLFFCGPVWVIPASIVSGLIESIRDRLPVRYFFINLGVTGTTYTTFAICVGAPIENLTLWKLLLMSVLSITFIRLHIFWFNYLLTEQHDKNKHPLQLIILLASIGLFFGISIGYSYHIRPWISISFAAIFYAILQLMGKINKLQNETEKLQLFSEFIDVDEKFRTLQEAENHIIQIAETVTKRQDITINNFAPTQFELGREMRIHNHASLWIKVPTQGCSQYMIKNNERDLDIVAILGERALEKYLLTEDLNTQALKDPLTGLANRRAFNTLLEHEIAAVKRQHGTISILYIDLDGFKPINDTYGHKAGDTVLISIAHRLSKVMRDQDCISRHGGDEFVILAKNIEQEHLNDLAQRILNEIKKPISIDDMKEIPHIVSVSASIGIASAPYNAIDHDELLRRADECMYEVKKSIKSQKIALVNCEEKSA